ncbi:amidohydrolase [Planctomonas deserti]|uniref:amidohydrolase n=1 Tax=Planctomonas deserti TaxID=2144185 RepID=UPI000D3AC13F|nr:amidohydrolase [Planctomonas deserti]
MTVDLVLHSGRVFTGTALSPTATAVAVTAGRIVGVGTEAEVRALGRAAETIDARGGLIAPSFIDAHIHPLQGGHERLHCDLTDATDAASTLDIIGAYAAAHPEDDWVVGGGWHLPHFPGGRPDAESLERVAPGRKIYLVNADHHGAWVSPAALRAAGVDRDTPDPAGGHFDRDAGGRPTGTAQEAAMEVFAPFLPVPDVDDYVEAVGEAQRYLQSFGITGWQDAIIGDYAGFGDSTEAYLRVVASGELVSRVTGALWLPRGLTLDTIDDTVQRLVAARDAVGDRGNELGGSFRATTVKIMQDGVPESQTAAMKEPYLDACGHPTGVRGESHFPPDVLNAAAVALTRAGFQLHIHAIGDRAVAESLDALRAARAAGDDNRMRHHLAHLQQVDLADIPAMAELGVTANIQALWAAASEQMVDLNRSIVGQKRFSEQYPFASMAAAGVPLAMGSDWPVSTPDPWQAIAVAVTRVEPGSGAEPLGVGEELELGQAIAAYTSGSARVAHHDDAGTLRVGGVADIAVSDVDPFSLPADALHTVRTAATLASGRVVFSR